MAFFIHKKQADSDPPELTGDALLVDRAKNGDASAFGALVEKYSSFVYRTVFYDIKNREDAEDLSQDVFIKAYGALNGFRYDSEFSTWLFRICKNTVYDYLRKYGKNKTVSLSDMTYDEDGEKEAEIPDASGAFEPEKQVISNETSRAVQEAIRQLAQEHRDVIVLREIEGYSYAEIADILSLEEGTVKSRLSRARGALKKLLEDKHLL